MTTDQLPKLINARPFVPFKIRTADGRECEVRHPENIAYGGGRIAVLVTGDDFEIIDLPLVPSLIVSQGSVVSPDRCTRSSPLEKAVSSRSYNSLKIS